MPASITRWRLLSISFAALLFVARTAHAQATGSIGAIDYNQLPNFGGASFIDSTGNASVTSLTPIVFGVHYTVNLPAGDHAHLEADLNAPFAGGPVQPLGGAGSARPLSGPDGYGRPNDGLNYGAWTVVGPSIGGAQALGQSGIFSFQAASAGQILAQTTWTVPLRIIHDPDEALMASGQAQILINSSFQPEVAMGVIAVSAGPSPLDSTQSGSLVTYRLFPGNQYAYGFWGLTYGPGHFEAVESDPCQAASGGVLVPGTTANPNPNPTNPSAFPGFPDSLTQTPLYQSIPVNASPDWSATAGVVSFSADNFLGNNSGYPDYGTAAQFDVTCWYPNTVTRATNAVTAYLDGTEVTSNSVGIDLSNTSALVEVNHGCTDNARQTASAPLDPDCYAAPYGMQLVQTSVIPGTTSQFLLNPSLVVSPDSNQVFAEYLGASVNYNTKAPAVDNAGADDPAGWQVGYSQASDCLTSPDTTTWTLDDGTLWTKVPSDMALIQCLRFSFNGGYITAGYPPSFNFGLRLKEPLADALASSNGASQYATVHTRFSGGNVFEERFDEDDGTETTVPISPLGSYGPAFDQGLTYTNLETAHVSCNNDSYLGRPLGGVGQYAYISFYAPGWQFDSAGLRDLTFEVTLPHSLIIDGSSSLATEFDARYLAPEGISPGNISCTQTGFIATGPNDVFRCTIAGDIPLFRNGTSGTDDPTTVCTGATGLSDPNPLPYLCAEEPGFDYYSADNGVNVANGVRFLLKALIASGANEEVLPITYKYWSGGANARYTAANPKVATPSTPDSASNCEWTVMGTPLINITETLESASTAAIGSTTSYQIDFQNSAPANLGGAATQHTYIYDLFGRSPNGDPLPSPCYVGSPTLISASLSTGTPGDIQVALNPLPAGDPKSWPAGTWSSYASTNLSNVGAVRAALHSNYSSDPALGEFSLLDTNPAVNNGFDQLNLSFTTPDTGGATLCNSAGYRSDSNNADTAAAQVSVLPAGGPCLGALTYSPWQGIFGTMLFEDNYPYEGDLDFNDQTVAYNYVMAHVDSHTSQVTELQATYNVLAVGATFHNDLFLHIPGVYPTDVASMAMSTVVGGLQIDTVPQAELGETYLVISLANHDTRSLFPADPNESFINTDSSLPTQAAAIIKLLITFKSGKGPDGQDAPFDLYIARNSPFHSGMELQVHKTIFAGTDKMDQTVFDNPLYQDNSDLTLNKVRNGVHFVDLAGLPFVLDVPAPLGWMQETIEISRAYDQIMSFATDDSSAAGWYSAASDPTLLFSGGTSGPGVPVPTFLPPDIQACP